MRKRAMVVDDDVESLWNCARVLKEHGFEVTACSQSMEAMDKFKTERPDVVLLDIKMHGKSGFELLDEMRALDNRVCIIMLSAFGDAETVVRALKQGADNFADKPLDPEKLLLTVEKEMDGKRLEMEVRTLRGMHDEGPATVDDIIGRSEAIEKVRREIKLFADTADVVLVTGRPGVGKNLVARALHGESRRRSGALVHRHCGALAPTIFESAVFGHRKGAFTDARYDKKGAIEAAENGTLFLDEIGTLSTDTQAKLLLVIEGGVYSRVGDEGNVERTSAKFVAATNEDVERAVLDRRFREDLFHRLKDAWIKVPPLCERKDDILPLADHFMGVESRSLHLPAVDLSSEARGLLLGHTWPDNVRGLRQVIRNVLRVGDESVISATIEKPESVTGGVSLADCTDLHGKVEEATREVEKSAIQACLQKFAGNRRHVADQLGISYRSLLYKMKRYALRDGPWDHHQNAQ